MIKMDAQNNIFESFESFAFQKCSNMLHQAPGMTKLLSHTFPDLLLPVGVNGAISTVVHFTVLLYQYTMHFTLFIDDVLHPLNEI